MSYVLFVFYVYIITNKPNGTIYTGQTDNLQSRIWEHKNKVQPGFSKKYNLDKLVWYDTFETREAALETESRMKNWKREWKVRRIEEDNPHWKDLTKDLGPAIL